MLFGLESKSRVVLVSNTFPAVRSKWMVHSSAMSLSGAWFFAEGFQQVIVAASRCGTEAQGCRGVKTTCDVFHCSCGEVDQSTFASFVMSRGVRLGQFLVLKKKMATHLFV